jgi:hypothetical protein
MLQNIAHIECLGWHFIRKENGKGLVCETECNVYSGEFYGNVYLLTIHSDNTIKISIVHTLIEYVCQRVEKETFEFVPIFHSSCNSLESLVHICNEIIVPTQKVKGKRKRDSNLFKPKPTTNE